MIFNWSILSLIFAVSATSSSSSRDKIFVEKIEARVGSQIITSTDLELEVQNIKSQLMDKEPESSIRKKALEARINRALIRDYLGKVQMAVSEQEVDRRVNSIRASNGIGTLEEFRQMLEAQGLSLETFRSQIRDQMEIGQFNQVLERQQLRSVDEREMKSYYTDNSSKFENYFEMDLKECVLMYNDQTEAATKAIARKFVNKPSQFQKCVKSHSRAPSAQRDGELGTITSDMLREDISRKLAQAKKGQAVRVDMPGAIQLLKIEEKRSLGPRSFDQVKSDIRKMIEAERLSMARERMLEELRSSTFIQVDS